MPAFARKYQTSCTTCHTVFPALNSFGEAFRRNGFRFPSHEGSVDSDNVRAQMLALGREQYKDMFPNAVWPSSVPVAVPLSLVTSAGTSVNLPDSAAHDAAGNTLALNGLAGEAAIFGAGALNDTLTYFIEVSISEDGAEIEHAYVVWEDLIAAPHAINLAVGRLPPTLMSFGPHGSYVTDLLLAAPSIGGLYNSNAPGGALPMGFGHPDGLEVNGVVNHRVDYSVGWIASGAGDALSFPNSQDVYAHLGAKLGGMTLDGEGPGGTVVPNPMRPWEEMSITFDVFGYHGLQRTDNGASAQSPTPQNDRIDVLGGTIRAHVQSFIATVGLWAERHSAPYAALPPMTMADDMGVADRSSAVGVVQFNELAYIVYPWLVPVLRTEFVQVPSNDAHGGRTSNVARLMPGVAALIRPNLKVTLVGDIERAMGGPPAMSWEPGGGIIAPQPAGTNRVEAERLELSLVLGF
ncbi:MAG: hypothetical protein PVI30_26630 [Myxococcales bacterium]